MIGAPSESRGRLPRIHATSVCRFVPASVQGMRAPTSGHAWAQPAMERCVERVMRQGNVPEAQARAVLQQVLQKATTSGPLDDGHSRVMRMQYASRWLQLMAGQPPSTPVVDQSQLQTPSQLSYLPMHQYQTPPHSPPHVQPWPELQTSSASDFSAACFIPSTVQTPFVVPGPPPPPPPPPFSQPAGQAQYWAMRFNANSAPVPAPVNLRRAAAPTPRECRKTVEAVPCFHPNADGHAVAAAQNGARAHGLQTQMGPPPAPAQPCSREALQPTEGKQDVANSNGTPQGRHVAMQPGPMHESLEVSRPSIPNLAPSCHDGLLLLSTTAGFVPRAVVA